MEECLDWDVEVEAAVHTYGLASVPTQPLKKGVLVPTIHVGGNSVLGSGRESTGK